MFKRFARTKAIKITVVDNDKNDNLLNDDELYSDFKKNSDTPGAVKEVVAYSTAVIGGATAIFMLLNTACKIAVINAEAKAYKTTE